jgi:hypothetical protein
MATDRQSWSLKLGIPDHPLPSLLQPHQVASSMHLLDIGSGNEYALEIDKHHTHAHKMQPMIPIDSNNNNTN